MSQIDASLAQLQRGRGLTMGVPHHRVVGGTVVDQPICALVLCAYETEAWPSSVAVDQRQAGATQELLTC